MELAQHLFLLLGQAERVLAYAQGKGYGAATIQREVSSATALLHRPANLIVDIGGNVGRYSEELRRVHPGAEIHIFEPSQTNVAKLRALFHHDPRTTINPVALSDAAFTRTLFSDAPGSGLASLTKRRLDHFDIAFECTEEVNTIRFEDYWRNHLNRRPIDIVKLDVEGHELDVLCGFGEAFGAVSVYQFEFGGANIDTRTYFQDFYYLFEEAGYDLWRIAPFGLHQLRRYREALETFSTTNFLARRRE